MAPETEDMTKEQLLDKLRSENKRDIVSALQSRITKDDLVDLVSSKLKKEELADLVEAAERSSSDEDSDDDRQRRGSDSQQGERDEDTSLDWEAELDWAPPPQPTPAPVAYTGAAPSMPGQRVRVDLAGLPMMGVFAGRGASAAGTITGVDARNREIKIWLDAAFDGEKEIVLPPERVSAEPT